MLLLRRVVSVPLVLFGVPLFGIYAAQVFAGHLYRVFGLHIDGAKWGEVLTELSLCAAAIGVLLLLSVYAARILCGGSRRRLAAVFGPVVRGLSVGVAVLALLQMAVAVASALMLMLVFLHVIPLGLLLPVLVGAFYTAAELVRIGLGLSAPHVMQVTAAAISRTEQPAFWERLTEVAERLGARLPDHVILGLQPGFFATGAKVRLPDGTLLHGETMYVSLADMRALSQAQFSAVIGHELSHFVGDDTRFSLRFLPIYKRLRDGLDASYATVGLAAITAMPSRLILREALLAFAKVEARIGRAREIAADKAGALVADERAMVGAILLEAITHEMWTGVARQVIEAINSGAPMFAPCERLEVSALARMHHIGGTVSKYDGGLEGSDRAFDTHPIVAARARALGVGVDETLVFIDQVEAPAVTLLRDVPQLSLMLRDLFVAGLIESGLARPPRDPSRPNFVQKKRLQRIKQAEARKRRAETGASQEAS